MSIRENRGPLLVADILLYAVLVALALVGVFPLYWMFVTSFKHATLVISMVPQIIPLPPTVDNFKRILNGYLVMRWTLNSILVAVVPLLPYLFFTNLAGYVFAKKKFPGSGFLFWLIVGTMMIPFEILMIPLFLLVAGIGLTNRYLGVMLPLFLGPYGVFLMRQFAVSIPSELLDAAKIDGCHEIGVFTRIVLPLSRPAWGVLGILGFVGNWNLFLWPLIVTTSNEMETIQVGVSTLTTAVRTGFTDYGLIMSGAVFAAVPVIVVFFLFQRYFVRGITIGALKG